MVLSDLIRTLSQSGRTPARQQYQSRSPYGQKIVERQAALMQDMKLRQRQRAQQQAQQKEQLSKYQSSLRNYSQKRRALGRSDSTLYGEGALQGKMREDYLAKRIGARPTMPTEPTTSTANIIKQRYQRPKRTTSSTKSWRNTRSTMPTGNRQFLRGVKFE